MIKLILKAKNEHNLTKNELCTILKTNTYNKELFEAANETRKNYIGDEVYLRALIEFSNICKNNCLYCGLRAENNQIKRYTLTTNELINCANKAISQGFKTIVLQSGESSSIKTDELCNIIKTLKTNDIAITLSIGEKTLKEYQELKNAGADRFLLRIETTDKNLYKKMHPNMNYENRINCLKNIKKLNYELGTGSLIGLPNQTIESIADDILFFKEINADMIGIGPFIAHKQTPLKDQPNGDLTLALKAMALTRLLLPNINIPATTAMETIEENGRLKALQCGANVIMPNFTHESYKEKYDIYPNKKSESFNDNLACQLQQIGRTIKMSKGNSKNYKKDSNENSK